MNNNKSRTRTGQYIPNFDNPRIRKRVKKALGWAAGCVRSEPREMAKNWIDVNLGQQQNELGAWLRAKLLICQDNFYYFGVDGGKCKEYSLNQSGWDEVSGMLLGIEDANAAAPMQKEGKGKSLHDMELIHAWARDVHKKEFDSKDFQYEEKQCARLWHPLQNLKKDAKAYVWKKEGLSFDYDIQACAPTLILQHAQQLGFDEWPHGIQEFLADPRAFRKHVAEVAGYDYNDDKQAKKVKALVNAMFCGAKLGANKDFALFQLLDENYERVNALKNDTRLMLLKDDIKRCWKVIESESMYTVKNENGRKLALNSKRKWGRYFDLERLVLDAVRFYLIKSGVKFFLEHDGWRTDQVIDVESLQEHVFVSTGYRIKIAGTSSRIIEESLPADLESIPNNYQEAHEAKNQEGMALCQLSPIVLRVNAEKDYCEIVQIPSLLSRLRNKLLISQNMNRPNG
ncbi:hypothetical protein O0882_20615 [Janthinobacterium sp. SUN073]|uniref:hypothetical protein n=1 Tax=Janthinobacterium sp. SUN073 TaxID=3004102 RepID=UPI0025AF452B|nr:hypothetical protein [Janthinobacterium sp. SUN073]MDN2698723.1 hypothetical protein [Janthinobacterium sp. SUN073]